MTVSFKTFGCRLNRAETERFEAGFSAAGVACVPFGEPADIVVIHTCAVTQTAENEGLRLARSLRAKRPGTLIVLSGCAAEAASPERLARTGADLVVRREDRDRLVTLILERLALSAEEPLPSSPSGLQRALLKVQDGCSCFCTYCIVPYTRGAPVSRPFDDCLDEARLLIDKGFQEIVVVGCNLAFYADGGKRLPDLLSALTSLPGTGRIRLGSLEPGVCEDEVVRLMAENRKLCAFLHLPLQSGDDEILARMGRRYGSSEIRRMLDGILEQVPILGLGADFITGFPGETVAQFQNTRRLIEDYPFANLHVFPYSERPGTPAATYPCSIPVSERKRRTNELIALREEKKQGFAQRHVGHPVDVLVENVDAEGTGRGWTADYVECRVSGLASDAVGKLRSVIPLRAGSGVLFA